MRQEYKDYLKQMRERRERIYRMWFKDKLSFHKIALKEGITASRVQQIVDKARKEVSRKHLYD